ncbi:hypothetical protein CDAR_228931 [Caerostris darwini]|uniref:Uncharacterized protein n=1 Tax=Caerostris darwini TaxID=1538125 RepID=A0AAV4VNA3_9ARAC|nr:hypothetical protein CDAR_228931 [Caerostris darwini]
MTALWKQTFSPNQIFSVSIRSAASQTDRTRLDLQSHYDFFFAQLQWRVSYCISRLFLPPFTGLFAILGQAGCHLLRGIAVLFFPRVNRFVAASETVEEARSQSQYDFLHRCSGLVVLSLPFVPSGLYCILVRLDVICFVELHSAIPFLSKLNQLLLPGDRQNEARSPIALGLSCTDAVAGVLLHYRLLPEFTGLYCDFRLGWRPSACGIAFPFIQKESVIGLSFCFLRAVKKPQSYLFPGFYLLFQGLVCFALKFVAVIQKRIVGSNN